MANKTRCHCSSFALLCYVGIIIVVEVFDTNSEWLSVLK